MLDLDLEEASRLGVIMDDETRELIAHLCTRTGMFMEDLSAEALTIGNADPERIRGALDDLERGAKQIMALIAAANALIS